MNSTHVTPPAGHAAAVSSHPPDRPKPKLVVLVTHPIQYYAPLYRTLAKRAAIGLEVIYLSDAGAIAHQDPGFAREVQWDVPLLEGHDYRVLQPGTPITSRGFWRRHDRRLKAALVRVRPDWLLVYGYASRMNWLAVRWARRHGVKVAYTSDSNIRNPERLVPVKQLVVGQFFRYVDAFLSPSERNVEYLRRYRADGRKIQRIPFAIDVARFTPSAATGIRRYDFVWAGKLIALKRCLDFISALEILASRSSRPIKACVIGDGPRRELLQAQARQLPSHCDVDFTGFVNQGGMPSALQAARTLIFTSLREPYGLIATEAAAAGLALVVADDIGCVGATVVAQPGINALTYKAGDIGELANAMDTLLHDATLRKKMQHASLEIAKYHDVACAAEVIERLVCRSSTQ